MIKKVIIVGAGFSGAVVARELAEAGIPSIVIDEREHLAGNCYTERCAKTNINLHKYGPHIFHTDNQKVWEYINTYCKMEPYINRVKSSYNNKIYSLPINLNTINQFFGKNMTSEEAKDFIISKADHSITHPKNFEEQALSMIGRELYEAFFYGYTLKQWGVEPVNLPASILKRLPLRFTEDDNYYFHKYQGIPRNGYTSLITNILDHSLIKLKLNTAFDSNLSKGTHVFYSGCIDRYYNYQFGRLKYRTLTFKSEIHNSDYLGSAVMNFADMEVPYTRITEHKHFAPWEHHEKTVIFKEYSSACDKNDIPYYPVRLAEDKTLLQRYQNLADKDKSTTFIGRLGTYRYLDMDACVKEALEVAELYLAGNEN